MEIFDKCWRKLAFVKARQLPRRIQYGKTTSPGPLIGDINALRLPWGPTMLFLKGRIAAPSPSCPTVVPKYAREASRRDRRHSSKSRIHVILREIVKKVETSWAWQKMKALC